MSTTENALTVHLIIPAGHPGDQFLAGVCDSLVQRFRISHSTLQIEMGDAHPCVLAPESKV
jgi:cobalt-zinc-cadmium efflux system protein